MIRFIRNFLKDRRAADGDRLRGADERPDQEKIQTSVYCVGPATFTVSDPAYGSSGTANCCDLSVTYSQLTTSLMFPGPTMALTRKKRVWIATSV